MKFLPRLFLLLTLLISGLSSFALRADDDRNEIPPSAGYGLFSNLPLYFTPNQGQWEQQILFKADAQTVQIGFTRNSIIHRIPYYRGGDDIPELAGVTEFSLVFAGAGKKTELQGNVATTSVSNYLITKHGNDPATEIPNYAELRYTNLYDGIDLKYYGTYTSQKYDFILQPGARVDAIQLLYENVDKVSINALGELEIITEAGTLREGAPVSYQIIDGQRIAVDIRYEEIGENTIGFKAYSSYDSEHELVIDPYTLLWSTHVRGQNASAKGGHISSIVVDSANYTYATGVYHELFTVTAGAYQSTYTPPNPDAPTGDDGDIFVFKLSADGDALIYSTYVGGDRDDRPYDLAIHSDGKAYVVGSTSGFNTSSNSYPTTANAYDPVFNGVCNNCRSYDGLFFVLSADGTALDYSTFIGIAPSGCSCPTPDGWDELFAVAVDVNGVVYLAGYSQGGDPLPFEMTSGAYDQTNNGGSDGLLLKLDPSVSGTAGLLYATYLGGSQTDQIDDIEIDASGRVYILGSTFSTDLPTVSPFQSTNNSDPSLNMEEVFFAIMDLDGLGSADLEYLTYFGGMDADGGCNLLLRDSTVYFTAQTSSINFPLLNEFDNSLGGLMDVGLVRFDCSTLPPSLISSTFFGGTGTEEPNGLAVNSCGEVYLCGEVNEITSPPWDFPTTTDAFQETPIDTTNSGSTFVNFFLSKFDDNVTLLRYSTYFGSSSFDGPSPNLTLVNNRVYGGNMLGICESQQTITTSGITRGLDFPVTAGVLHPSKLTPYFQGEPVVFKFCDVAQATADFSYSVSASCDTVQFTDLSYSCPVGLIKEWLWSFPGASSTSSTTIPNPMAVYLTTGSYSVTLQIVVGGAGGTVCQDTITITKVIDVCTILSVDLVNFSAESIDDEVQCNWATASESNCDYFTVERSMDGIHFNSVGKVNGAGNSSAKNSYSLIDNNPYSGYSYYRLKQIDFDGRVTAYPANTVYIDDQSIVLYPNPTGGVLNFQSDQQLDIEVFSPIGQIVAKMHQTNEIDLSDYPAGVYLIKIYRNGDVITRRILKR